MGLALAAWAVACDDGGNKVAVAVDTVPPETVVEVRLLGGRSFEHPAGTPLITRAAVVEINISANEQADLIYQIGEAPLDPSRPDVSRGGRRIALSLSEDATVRWIAVDVAGNASAPQALEVRFDRIEPTLTLSHEPGAYSGPIELTVEADEPALFHYTTNGRWPLEGAADTTTQPAPLVLPIDRSLTLNLLALDDAGHRVELRALAYDIDTQAPQTRAVPPPGHYLGAVEVALIADDPAADIYVSLDGSDPGVGGRRYDGPFVIDQPTAVRFRAVDAGGNQEATQVAEYGIGARTPPAPALVGALTYDATGGLGLAAALLRLAGPLGGGRGAALTEDPWTLWAVGRSGIDSAVFQAGVGPHAMHAPLSRARAEAGGQPDEPQNGTNRDDTWQARVEALAAQALVSPPTGLHPPFLAYRQTTAQLLSADRPAWLPDGRPAFVADAQRRRWRGAGVEDRRVTAGASAALIRALWRRGLAGVRGSRVGGPTWEGAAAATVGLRCAGCHRAGQAMPPLDSAQAVIDSALVTPGDVDASPLLAWLAGAGGHPTAPAPAARVEAVSGWIAAGAVAVNAAPRLGAEGDDALLGLIALDHLPVVIDALDVLWRAPDTGEAPIGPGAAYVPALTGILETGSAPGLPRQMERTQVEDRALVVAENGALLAALAAVAAGADLPASLRGRGPLGDGDGAEAALRQATRIALALVDHAEAPEGGFPALWRPGTVRDARVDTYATAQAVRGLAAAAAVQVPGAGAAAQRSAEVLSGLRLPAGPYATGRVGDALDEAAASLRDQLAVLGAFSVLATPAAAAARDGLWAHLDGQWWDGTAGAWQTTRGDAAYRYDAALVALAAEAIADCVASGGCAEGSARLQALLAGVALPQLLRAETWLTGEIGAPDVADTDGDGWLRPEWATAADADGAAQGIPPVFSGQWIF